MLDTLEKFYIYKETKLGDQINDKLIIQSNPIFEVLVQHELTQRTATSHIESESYDITLSSNSMRNHDLDDL